jgi:archaellum biogenesis ATPase FlaH
MIYGPSGAGKSFFALEICKSLLMGIPLFGRYATKKSSVLYLASESESSFISRLESIAEYNNISLESLEGFYFYPNGYDLKDKDSADEIIKIINALPTKPSLFIVDTLSRNLHGDENSSKDTSALVQICDDIRRETKITVLLVHHTGKDDVRGPRGHSSLFAACDTVIKVSGGPIMTTCQVICEKLKDGFPFSSYVLEKTPVILNNPVDIRFKEGLVLTLDENNPTKSNESIMSDFIELFPENEENAITLKEVWDKYRGYFDEVGWRSQQTLKNKMVIARTMKQVKYRLMYTRCGKNNHFKYYKKLNDSVEK